MRDFNETAISILHRLSPNREFAMPTVASLSWQGEQCLAVRRLLGYLAEFGRVPSSPAELLDAVLHLPTEEELGAHPVREGVVVSFASSGEFLLFIA